MVGYRIPLYVDTHAMSDKLTPARWISRAWIPHPIGDQVWLWYGFENIHFKVTYLVWIKTINPSAVAYDGTELFAVDMFMQDEEFLDQKEIDRYCSEFERSYRYWKKKGRV